MKKIKLLTALTASTAIIATCAPVLTACNDKRVDITPIIDEETKAQFLCIDTNCVLNANSTIKFTLKQDQELDTSSIEIKVNDKKLDVIKDYKIESNTITIYYYAMTSTNVTVKADAKNCHVIDKLEFSFLNKPTAKFDTLTPNDIEAKLSYKDGETEVLPWGADGYRIFTVKTVDGEEVKLEVTNFDTTPYTFDTEILADSHFHFEITYARDEAVKATSEEITIVTMNQQVFLNKYETGLSNYSKTISNYNWMIFDSTSTYTYKGETENVVSASLSYNESNNPIARFKNAEYVTSNTTIQVANFKLEILWKLLYEEYADVSKYTKTFTNTADTISVNIEDVSDPTKYLYLEFDKNTYLKNWINVMDSSKDYYGTKITHIYYQKSTKIATLTTHLEEPAASAVSLKCCDPLYPSNEKRMISETDNKFKLKINASGSSNDIFGKCIVKNGDVEVYSSDAIMISAQEVVETLIEINDWSKISHDEDLTVEFKIINYARVYLGTDAVTKACIDSLEFDKTTGRYIYESDKGYLHTKVNTKDQSQYEGSFYITEDQANAVDPIDDSVIARSEYCDRIYHRCYIDVKNIDWTKLDDINKPVYLHYCQPREFSFVKGTTLSTYFPESCEVTTNYTSEAQPCVFTIKVKNTLETTINHVGKFLVTATIAHEEEEDELVEVCSTVCQLNEGQQTITIKLEHEDWNKFKDKSELTVEFKTDDTLFNVEELQGDIIIDGTVGQTINAISFEHFMYSNDSEESLINSKIWIKDIEWVPVSYTGDFIGIDWKNSSTEFTANNKIRITIPTVSWDGSNLVPDDGDEYKLGFTLCFESDKTYKEWTFQKLPVKFRMQ